MFATTALAGMIAQVYAQTPPAQPTVVESVVVTGYRASIESATKDKREATGFRDSIYAEDIGKFPDSNIAESLNRIPGVLVSREITGEGLSISVRGLGTSFTKILLNGAPVAVASTGRTDNQNTNREVDLDLLPADLFRRLTVYKSPTAAMIEGGAAGVVDMRTARAFDNPGRYAAVSVQGVESQVADKWGNRGSVVLSNTWGNEFGILGGFAWSQMKVRTTGFETIGWTNPNLSATQSLSATRNNTGGGNWTIPGTVPANAGNGLTTGATVDQAFLLARNPGMSITQIDNAIIPRLGREMFEEGTKDKNTAVLSAEWRPNRDMYFYVDATQSRKKNEMDRVDMNWVGRNGAMIPLNMQVDREDCSQGCVVTQATYANAQWFLEFRPYDEEVTLKGINPGMEWQIAKNLKLDAQLNYTESEFRRESPTVLPITAGSSGVTVNYTNGSRPTIATNIDLNNPANFVWDGGRVNQQMEIRNTETKGGRFNLTWGDAKFNVKGGMAYDDISRRIEAFDNSGAWQAATCGNNPSVFLLGPNGAPPCNGASTPGASAAALYPGYGTGYTAGAGSPASITYRGSLIPLSNLRNYLTAGPGGFITVDWERFATDSNYGTFVNTAPSVGSSNTGASAGYIAEKITGAYVEVNGDFNFFSLPTKYNAGVRYVKTEQTVGGFISITDPRNVTFTQNGSRYPNIDNVVNLESDYNNTLPSASISMNLAKDVVFKASASRTMTRADPNGMRPGINFSSPSADTGSVGNPELDPYLSNNLDLGLEWYTGASGYVSVVPFGKKIKGFTTNENVTMPFSALAPLGVTYDTLSPTQQAAINARGGPGAATVVITRPTNAEGYLKIKGLELSWVQPLDQFLPVKGLGFSANYTRIKQSTSGGVSGAVALGVPEKTYNITGYYENDGIMVRLSQTYQEGSQVATANQNGITAAALYSDDYKQLDFSSAFDIRDIFNLASPYWPTITFDVTNLTREKQRAYFQFENATFTEYTPGRTYVVGLRLKF
ncbi:TonB-dependent receptor [Usitatibacter palustris]|uniref:TonB-dependent receptor n=1 Tax=Usitatibacter palustris TaxID=2732487 RepID=UPI001FE7DE51|nr:TonB-dependent receptor [Usitatibacter palustris]